MTEKFEIGTKVTGKYCGVDFSGTISNIWKARYVALGNVNYIEHTIKLDSNIVLFSQERDEITVTVVEHNGRIKPKSTDITMSVIETKI